MLDQCKSVKDLLELGSMKYSDMRGKRHNLSTKESVSKKSISTKFDFFF